MNRLDLAAEQSPTILRARFSLLQLHLSRSDDLVGHFDDALNCDCCGANADDYDGDCGDDDLV